MGKVLLVPQKDTRRRAQLETALRDAQQMKEQYKHNALLHKLHTINCEYIERKIAQRDLWTEDKSDYLKQLWTERKHLQKLNKD